MNERSDESGREHSATPNDFIRERIAGDVAAGKHAGKVHTRFPPEPNGYLHIGHAKAIQLNFDVAREFGGLCNLRFDDTNPAKEETEFVDSIRRDVHWLGGQWDDREFFASDYFERLYEFAEHLIRTGHAYVDDLSADEIRAHRGTLTEPGRESPYRDRSVEENLDLFRRMRAGEFEDGSRVLRAKIDMASPNMSLRDPTLYRIRRAHHHRTGDDWCIYPMYDYTHPLSDALEGVTHSLCTLEFENNRPLYDWCLDHVPVEHRPEQIEFARLKLNYTVLSKRKLMQLVAEGHVDGWDDPRMPTLSAMRRRGYTPEAIRDFCDRIGVAKRDSVVDLAQLEFSIRDDLNRRALRRMGVLRPLRLVIEDWPEGKVDELDAINNPEDPSAGSRTVPFTETLYIEREDFAEEPPPKYFRLAPGREVRLRYGYLVTCTGVVKDDAGEVIEVRCTHDPDSRGGNAPDGRRVKGTIHWVSADHAIDAEVRLYDRLFRSEQPGEGGAEFKDDLNPDSLTVLTGCKLEPCLADAEPGVTVQFERLGYFCPDTRDSRPDAPVFNRTVTLRDTWVKIAKRQGKQGG